jgi:hypothetical protein
VKETELWQRLETVLGSGYYRVWAEEFSLAELGNRTVVQALAHGTPSKTIWRAVWAAWTGPFRGGRKPCGLGPGCRRLLVMRDERDHAPRR